MKILHIVETLKGGGAETFVRQLLPRLRDRGIDSRVVAMYAANLTDQERAGLGCDVYEVHKRGRYDLGAPYRLFRIVKEVAPDIAHTHVVTGKYWGRACAAFAGVPVIVHTEHSSRPRIRPWEWPASFLLNRRTDAVITFSERTAAFLRRRERASKLFVIPNGIQVGAPPSALQRSEARRALQAGDKTVIGMVGNLLPVKNYDLALKAFSLLPPPMRATTRLDIFGAGPLDQHLRSRANDLGLNSSVAFWGFNSNVHELLAGFDLLLSTSLRESAPLSFLEAMNAGLPIIGTPSMGTLDIVDDGITGTVVRTWEAGDVAQALKRAIDDPAWRVQASTSSWLRLKDNFDIEIVADRHLRLYEDLTRAG